MRSRGNRSLTPVAWKQAIPVKTSAHGVPARSYSIFSAGSPSAHPAMTWTRLGMSGWSRLRYTQRTERTSASPRTRPRKYASPVQFVQSARRNRASAAHSCSSGIVCDLAQHPSTADARDWTSAMPQGSDLDFLPVPRITRQHGSTSATDHTDNTDRLMRRHWSGSEKVEI